MLGEEKKVLDIYRKIYDQGTEPKVFINDFLELVYYLKNINSLTLEGTNFSLNDEEFSKIKEISNKIDKQVLILFWQFTIRTLDELDIVSNQNLSIEMFLMRLIYLIFPKSKDEMKKNDTIKPIQEKNFVSDYKIDTIDQIKNITQEKKIKPEAQIDNKEKKNFSITSFEELIKICGEKKEVKLKYELEKNVNLVSFEKQRIEISFNDDLDKEFIKILTSKLYDWTNKRWIITLSKEKGDPSIKEKEINVKKNIFEKNKESVVYKKILENFPDAEMTEVKIKKGENDD